MKIIILFFLIIDSYYTYSFLKFSNFRSFSFKAYLRYIADSSIKKEVDKMCSKSSDDLLEFYQKTKPDYFYSPPKGNDKIKEIIDKLFEDVESDIDGEIEGYLNEKIKDIFIIIIIFILLLILWIPFTVMICCKRCLCFPKSIYKYIKIFIYICFAFLLAILINNIITFFENKKISKGVFGTGCSIFKIIHHFFNGDDYQIKPYWYGIQTILNNVRDAKNNITSLISI